MSSTFEYDVFISFASANEAQVKPIWQELSLGGLRVFWSNETLKQSIGDSFSRVIMEALEKSRHLLLIASDASMASVWVELEYETFFNHFHLHNKRNRKLIIYPLNNFPLNRLPLLLKNLQVSRSMTDILPLLGGTEIQQLRKENRQLKVQIKTLEHELAGQAKALKMAQEKHKNAAQADKSAIEKKRLLAEIAAHQQKIATLEKRASREAALADELAALKSANAQLQKELANSKSRAKTVAVDASKSSLKTMQGGAFSFPPLIEKLGFRFVPVKGGTFQMGSADDDKEAYDNEKPQHSVRLSDFYIADTPVTQKQWHEVMGENPAYFKKCDNCPVEQVSWEDAQAFIQALNQKSGLSFRLPTEAEWEYAARGGEKSKGYRYAGSDNLAEVGWYNKNSGDKTHPVKGKKANELGLYDMSGNVWEWCEDRWHDGYNGAPADGSAWVSGSGPDRVLRGGYWGYDARNCRSANRSGYSPGNRSLSVGFRLVFVPQ